MPWKWSERSAFRHHYVFSGLVFTSGWALEFLSSDEATDGGSIRFFKKMGLLDKRTREDGATDDIVLMTTLFYDVLEEAAAGTRDLLGAVNEFLDPVIDRIAMPRRIADAIRRMMFMVPHIMVVRR